VLTLAPEMTTPDMIAELTAGGVLVSAGHSNATFAETTESIARGLRGFTHLFNAMAPLAPRAPGIIGATEATTATNSWVMTVGLSCFGPPGASALSLEF